MLKFRAWDKEKKKMVTALWRMKIDMFGNILWTIDHYDGGLNLIGREEIDGNDRFVLMRYTGLRDSKRTAEYPEGQEIYEGDIVKWFDEEECWPVYYEMATCQFTTKERWLWTNKENIEVIGNVYNNPDLLKGGQPDAE